MRKNNTFISSVRFVVLTIAVLTATMLSVATQGAPSSDAWEMWHVSDEESGQQVSHAKWQTLLDQYLIDDTDDGINLFAYSKVSKEDKKLLKSYLNDLAGLDPRGLNRAEQQAYWINMYNALTIDVVLDEYPVKSIRKIRFLSSPFGPWDKSLLKVAGEKVTLNDIEHRILRPIWQDERIHFAVNCASIGCPNLQGTAFTADNTEALLDKGADEFVNHKRGVARDGDTLMLSSIFDWYGVDFGNNQDEIIESLGDYLNEDNANLLLPGFTSVKYDYDWSLNGVN